MPCVAVSGDCSASPAPSPSMCVLSHLRSAGGTCLTSAAVVAAFGGGGGGGGCCGSSLAPSPSGRRCCIAISGGRRAGAVTSPCFRRCDMSAS
eukprot:scaffold92869_cov62-Phaeocystis_antarctica.AAC.1